MPLSHILPQLEINTTLARRVLVNFIRNEVHKVGFQRAVLGVSGGVDSALAAYLTAEALGGENIKALRMPYKTSSPDSLEHAQMVIDALGLRSGTIEITAMVDPLFEQFPNMPPLRQGNIMARQRMVILYDQSAEFNGLVIGTGNKTEMLLGYSTLFGDSAAALHPLGDLYKCQVRQLARDMGVPEAIIQKAPSADLWPGQTDEGELGYTYDEADQVLFLLIDRRYTREEVVQEGFAPAFVDRVYHTVRRTQYKRIMPLIPKLSSRTIGYDFLYLRDWGETG